MTTGSVGRVETGDEMATDPEPDLEAIHRDLDGVETALRRLDEGTYWTDESTGRPLPEALLATDPTARRAVD